MGEGDNDDDDYRSLATGYQKRAMALLSDVEHRKRGLRLRMGMLTALPPVALKPIADALPKLDDTQKLWLYVGSVVLGIAAAVFSVANQLADSRDRVQARKKRLQDLLEELEAIPPRGALSAWHRKVIDDANATIRGIRESMEK